MKCQILQNDTPEAVRERAMAAVEDYILNMEPPVSESQRLWIILGARIQMDQACCCKWWWPAVEEVKQL